MYPQYEKRVDDELHLISKRKSLSGPETFSYVALIIWFLRLAAY
jgi:hypothetical protein